MGSPFNIILYAKDAAEADQLAKQSFTLVDSLVNILSDYIDSSELNRLCARAGSSSLSCSPVLYEVLQLAAEAFRQSEGRFDITLGPVTRVWRKARKENKFPDPGLVKEKLALTGFRKIRIDTLTHTVSLLQEGMQLDLGGIGQGYIAQQVINFLKERGVEDALVDVSGDIVTIGKPPGTRGWTVAINTPESETTLLPKHLVIRNKAVTTSGDVYQYMLHDGKKYSHIVDPATGYGITTQRNVTVIAADGTMADWLTKACSLLPVSKAKALVRQLHAEVLIAETRNDKLQFHQSKGFSAYWDKSYNQQK